MNFNPIFILSLFFFKKEHDVIEQIQSLDQQIKKLRQKRKRLHNRLYIESRKIIFKIAKEKYSNLKESKNLPIFI